MTLGAHAEASPARPMRLEDWERLPEDEPGELVGGVLVEEEVPSYVHEATVVWLMGLMLPWCRQNGARVIGSGLKFVLPNESGRLPDLSLFLRGAPRPPAHGAARTPPSIAVEVVSSTPADARRDRIIKLSEYAEFGISWYWLVDPELRSVEILQLDSQRKYVHVVSATEGTVTEVPGCPGLSLPIDELWRELDEAMAEAAEPTE
ncbi:Uma2 family endonuclease [Paraliomyxa miuraensis]|uniref:Uma2 family endonuclease n=1 Tax=Paraliomyxa miuraensis TaxID=376150 RepID=UPI002255AFEF|nr:Uma2 family endonuclease [Paraliomyxa miuraensis]MCX4240093.1 Uma2 family endonuclease [Paraliomyxa miuraensis]